jgi:predicted deacylase
VARAEASRRLAINGVDVGPGERTTIDLPVARLYTHTPLTMPVHVVRGRKPGPQLFVSAAIHGDEINGVEIVRRLLKLPLLRQLRGALVAIPIVNVYGFIQHSRYLPDRRDLNRSFPGSEKGSLTARIANLFMREIVSHCTHGIDIHTGALHRANLPQIRARLDEPETERLSRAFGVPVLLNSDLRDGSLREAAAALGVPVLLYEAGEALRFDEVSVRAGVRGIVAVMRALSMLPAAGGSHRSVEPVLARSSAWVRAPASGVLRTSVPLGARVRKADLLGVIADPFGEREISVGSPGEGIVIGRVNLPLVNEGDALFHIAYFDRPGRAAVTVETFQSENTPEEPLLSEAPGA